MNHIFHVSCKVSKNIGIMYRVRYALSQYVLLNLYYALIYQYLSYCYCVWSFNYHSRLKRLSVLQRRTIRIGAKKLFGLDTEHCFSSLKVHDIVWIHDSINKFQVSISIFRF